MSTIKGTQSDTVTTMKTAAGISSKFSQANQMCANLWCICEDWFKINILKTKVCYCFIAAVLNSMSISLAEAIAMFDHFALLHNSVGEFDYRQASHRFQQYAKELTSFKGAFVVRKFAALLSFEEFFAICEVEQNNWILVYKTVNFSYYCLIPLPGILVIKKS